MTIDSYKLSIADYVIDSDDTDRLRVAFETKNAFPLICEKIAVNFINKIKNRLEKDYNILDLEIGAGSGYKFEKGYHRITIHIRSKKWEHPIWIGFKDHDNDRFYSFVSINNEIIKKELYPIVKLELGGTINPSQWWKRLKSPFNNWDDNIDGLEELYKLSSETVDYFINEVLYLNEIVEKYLRNK